MQTGTKETFSAATYPRSWPPRRFFVEPESVQEVQALAMRQLIKASAGETVVDEFLRQHPALLAACMNFTQFGHHGTWVVPQQVVRPPALPEIRGLKPDYLVGGQNSDGYQWYVVELKSPKDKLFKKARVGTITLSSTANHGLCQLLQYIDYCSSAQSYLRDTLRLKEFREPKGFLIIGREMEFMLDSDLQNMKRALNVMTSGRVEVRTFDALIRSDAQTWISEGTIAQE